LFIGVFDPMGRAEAAPEPAGRLGRAGTGVAATKLDAGAPIEPVARSPGAWAVGGSSVEARGVVTGVGCAGTVGVGATSTGAGAVATGIGADGLGAGCAGANALGFETGGTGAIALEAVGVGAGSTGVDAMGIGAVGTGATGVAVAAGVGIVGNGAAAVATGAVARAIGSTDIRATEAGFPGAGVGAAAKRLSTARTWRGRSLDTAPVTSGNVAVDCGVPVAICGVCGDTAGRTEALGNATGTSDGGLGAERMYSRVDKVAGGTTTCRATDCGATGWCATDCGSPPFGAVVIAAVGFRTAGFTAAGFTSAGFTAAGFAAEGSGDGPSTTGRTGVADTLEAAHARGSADGTRTDGSWGADGVGLGAGSAESTERADAGRGTNCERTTGAERASPATERVPGDGTRTDGSTADAREAEPGSVEAPAGAAEAVGEVGTDGED
jgi:hypothetical protein